MQLRHPTARAPYALPPGTPALQAVPWRPWQRLAAGLFLALLGAALGYLVARSGP